MTTKDQAIAQAVAWQPTEAAIAALKRFEETCTDNDGYDVPKDTMRNLQAIGLIYRTYGDMYCITDYGQHILATQPPAPDCRTCVTRFDADYSSECGYSLSCTNGDKYQPAPSVVLWRTE